MARIYRNPRVVLWYAILASASMILFAGLWIKERLRAEAFEVASACNRAIREASTDFNDVSVYVSHYRVIVYGRVSFEKVRVRLENLIKGEVNSKVGPAAHSKVSFEVEVKPVLNEK